MTEFDAQGKRPGISLEQWYPLVAGKVPTPVTKIVLAPRDMQPLEEASDEETARWVDDFQKVCADIAEAALAIGWPFFLRTGLTSCKHDWERTCYVPDRESIPWHVSSLITGSAEIPPFGLPSDIFVVRELLTVDPMFFAFRHMPITREFRFWVNGGSVLGWQPYWPPEAIEESAPLETPEWRARLARASKLDPHEHAALSRQSEMVSRSVPGAWSVDWLQARNGRWYLTDMAHAERSWLYESFPNAPKPAMVGQEPTIGRPATVPANWGTIRDFAVEAVPADPPGMEFVHWGDAPHHPAEEPMVGLDVPLGAVAELSSDGTARIVAEAGSPEAEAFHNQPEHGLEVLTATRTGFAELKTGDFIDPAAGASKRRRRLVKCSTCHRQIAKRNELTHALKHVEVQP
jgi:hypothetical protein